MNTRRFDSSHYYNNIIPPIPDSAVIAKPSGDFTGIANNLREISSIPTSRDMFPIECRWRQIEAHSSVQCACVCA